mmetsp:Transcript_22300/g.65756  ORF Transcript_22300/g.65756 Transcript_22300/m.65756 type:complete len:251 (+) Transcript_22300:160-912(+)
MRASSPPLQRAETFCTPWTSSAPRAATWRSCCGHSTRPRSRTRACLAQTSTAVAMSAARCPWSATVCAARRRSSLLRASIGLRYDRASGGTGAALWRHRAWTRTQYAWIWTSSTSSATRCSRRCRSSTTSSSTLSDSGVVQAEPNSWPLVVAVALTFPGKRGRTSRWLSATPSGALTNSSPSLGATRQRVRGRRDARASRWPRAPRPPRARPSAWLRRALTPCNDGDQLLARCRWGCREQPEHDPQSPAG